MVPGSSPLRYPVTAPLGAGRTSGVGISASTHYPIRKDSPRVSASTQPHGKGDLAVGQANDPSDATGNNLSPTLREAERRERQIAPIPNRPVSRRARPMMTSSNRIITTPTAASAGKRPLAHSSQIVMERTSLPGE